MSYSMIGLQAELDEVTKNQGYPKISLSNDYSATLKEMLQLIKQLDYWCDFYTGQIDKLLKEQEQSDEKISSDSSNSNDSRLYND